MKALKFPWFKKNKEPNRKQEDFEYHFIHIPKNGGTSVRAALERRGDVSLGEPFHSRYIDVVEQVGQDLKYFCVIRNPWSRTASRYVFAKQNAKRWKRNDPRKRYIERATFDDYVKDQLIFEIPEHPGKPWMGPMNSWFNQLEWITDKHGEVRCDCIRLERLERDLELYFGEHIQVPRENITKDRYTYRDMYNDKMIALIGETFARDIEYFGFEFEGTATRNILEITSP